MTRDILVDPPSALCHLVTPPLECHVLFEWLLTHEIELTCGHIYLLLTVRNGSCSHFKINSKFPQTVHINFGLLNFIFLK